MNPTAALPTQHRRGTIALGRLAGIPVAAEWTVLGVALAVVAVLGFGTLPRLLPDTSTTARLGAAAIGAVAFLACLLAHEFGHAVAARRHGVRVLGIDLWLLGGIARLDRQAPTPTAELQIALAGPGANLVLAGLLGGATFLADQNIEEQLVAAVLAWLTGVNLLLALTNLLPGAPLDGGRVLTALLWRRMGDAEAARLAAARTGLVIGVGLIALAGLQIWRWQQLAGWSTLVVAAFIAAAARIEIQSAAIRGRLARHQLAEVMVPYPPPIDPEDTVQSYLHSGQATARPVARWGEPPIGYVADSLVGHLSDAEKSWTTAAQVMAGLDAVTRGWSPEPLGTVLSRTAGEPPHVIVVHDPESGEPVGTFSRHQVYALVAQPIDAWGRERSPVGPEA